MIKNPAHFRGGVEKKGEILTWVLLHLSGGWLCWQLLFVFIIRQFVQLEKTNLIRKWQGSMLVLFIVFRLSFVIFVLFEIT